tara:strand:+ start:1444 stop:1704 length:261 start_codon:yes stop_codon:yes gene_type:complete
MLTLKKFKELTKNLPDNTILNTTIEFGNPNTLRGVINEIHIVPKKHSYSKEGYIVLSCNDKKRFIIKNWIEKNKYEVLEDFKYAEN